MQVSLSCSSFMSNIVITMPYVYHLMMHLCGKKWGFSSFGALSLCRCLWIRLSFNGCFLWAVLCLPSIVTGRWLHELCFHPLQVSCRDFDTSHFHCPFSAGSELGWFPLQILQTFSLSSGCPWLSPKGVTVIFKMHHLQQLEISVFI